MAVIKDGGTKTLSIDTERMLSFEPISFMSGRGPQGAPRPLSVARDAAAGAAAGNDALAVRSHR